ncbi:MAG: hypothetical protein Q9222_005592 [Ikaeria aurantiellina]
MTEELVKRSKTPSTDYTHEATIIGFMNEKPPFEASNLMDIATGALRHGMTWTVFRPEHGAFLAEGDGQVIRLVPGSSLSFEYIPGPQSASKVSNTLYIQSSQVDKLFFGILPGYRKLHLPDFRMGTTSEVYATMYSLDPTGTATKKVRDNRHPSLSPDCLFGFSDLIPLAAPMLRERGSTITRLPIPAQYTTGLLSHKEGFVVFRHRLEEFMNSPRYTKQPQKYMPAFVQEVKKVYTYLMVKFPQWEDEALANKQMNNRPKDFLDQCHGAWEVCTDYFVDLEDEDNHFYADLMATHLKHAVNWWHQAWNRMREGKARDNYGTRDYIAEGMHLYWDYLDLIVKEMQDKGWAQEDGDQVREAWILMIFRGMLWWRCHWMMDGDKMCEAPPRLPSECYQTSSAADGVLEKDYILVANDGGDPMGFALAA